MFARTAQWSWVRLIMGVGFKCMLCLVCSTRDQMLRGMSLGLIGLGGIVQSAEVLGQMWLIRQVSQMDLGWEEACPCVLMLPGAENCVWSTATRQWGPDLQLPHFYYAFSTWSAVHKLVHWFDMHTGLDELCYTFCQSSPFNRLTHLLGGLHDTSLPLSTYLKPLLFPVNVPSGTSQPLRLVQTGIESI